MAAIGASRSLRRVPATVSFLNPQPALSLAHANRPSCPFCDVQSDALAVWDQLYFQEQFLAGNLSAWCSGKDYSARYPSRHLPAWLTEVHVDLYCEQIRPDRLSRRPQTPDQCDAPHNRRKASMITALAQKPDEIAFRSRIARYKGAVHYERSC